MSNKENINYVLVIDSNSTAHNLASVPENINVLVVTHDSRLR